MGTLADAESRIRQAALRLVQEPDGRVRVEDYLTTLAAATGEAALAASGFDVEHHDLVPGTALAHDAVRGRLGIDPTGVQHGAAVQDAGARDEVVPEGTVWSILSGLKDRVVPASAFPSVADLRRGADPDGAPGWGEVPLTVGADHAPTQPPLRRAFELRPAVLRTEREFNAPVTDRHVVTASALASAIEQTKDAIDPQVALRLALEVVLGMTRMAPMTASRFAAAARS